MIFLKTVLKQPSIALKGILLQQYNVHSSAVGSIQPITGSSKDSNSLWHEMDNTLLINVYVGYSDCF